jgi:hypothetical protein
MDWIWNLDLIRALSDREAAAPAILDASPKYIWLLIFATDVT